ISESNAAAAIQTANVTASNADQRRFDGNAGNAFGLFYSAANGADGGIEIDDGAFAQAFRFGGAEREEFHLLVGKLRDKNTGFGATDVQTDKIFVLLRQASAPQFKVHKPICACFALSLARACA